MKLLEVRRVFLNVTTRSEMDTFWYNYEKWEGYFLIQLYEKWEGYFLNIYYEKGIFKYLLWEGYF